MEDPLTKKPDKITYEVLWKSIIRPPRDVYKNEDLGHQLFRYNNRIYVRNDYDILDFQGNLLKLSFIEPRYDNRPSEVMPCVIYLHSNSASRLEGLQMKLYLLKRNINLCVFDFAGCGKSEGKYISLGYYEKQQVRNVVDFIERLQGVGNIGIWGRSMGAATTLLYTPSDIRIKCIVVDSPFSDFRKLAKEMCLSEVHVPGILIEGAISIVGKTVYGKNGMDINDIKAINTVQNCYVPVMFIHAQDDDFVPYKHSEKLFQNYGGSVKKLKGVNGGHNGARSKILLEEVGEFFGDYLIPGYFESKQTILYINNKDKDSNKEENNDTENLKKDVINNKINENEENKINEEKKENEQK